MSAPLWRFCDSGAGNKCHELFTYFLTDLNVRTEEEMLKMLR